MPNDSGARPPTNPRDDDSDWPGADRTTDASREKVYQPPPNVAKQIVKAIIFAILGLIALVVLGLVVLYITCSGQSSW